MSKKEINKWKEKVEKLQNELSFVLRELFYYDVIKCIINRINKSYFI